MKLKRKFVESNQDFQEDFFRSLSKCQRYLEAMDSLNTQSMLRNNSFMEKVKIASASLKRFPKKYKKCLNKITRDTSSDVDSSDDEVVKKAAQEYITLWKRNYHQLDSKFMMEKAKFVLNAEGYLFPFKVMEPIYERYHVCLTLKCSFYNFCHSLLANNGYICTYWGATRHRDIQTFISLLIEIDVQYSIFK